ncbi:hypothetical protein HKD37_03G007209 [Glycine soja]
MVGVQWLSTKTRICFGSLGLRILEETLSSVGSLESIVDLKSKKLDSVGWRKLQKMVDYEHDIENDLWDGNEESGGYWSGIYDRNKAHTKPLLMKGTNTTLPY